MTKFNNLQGKIMYDLMHLFTKSISKKTSNYVKCEHIFEYVSSLNWDVLLHLGECCERNFIMQANCLIY